MARNVIDGSHFVKNLKKKKVAYRSEMARNAFKSEFRTSKMGAGGHFVKMIWKKSFVLIWNGQKCHRKLVLDIQNGRRQPFCKKITKIQIMVLIWNGKKWFLDIQNGYRRPFKKKKIIYKKVKRVIWTMFKPTAGRIQLDINSLLVNINTDRYVGNEGIYIVFAL